LLPSWRAAELVAAMDDVRARDRKGRRRGLHLNCRPSWSERWGPLHFLVRAEHPAVCPRLGDHVRVLVCPFDPRGAPPRRDEGKRPISVDGYEAPGASIVIGEHIAEQSVHVLARRGAPTRRCDPLIGAPFAAYEHGPGCKHLKPIVMAAELEPRGRWLARCSSRRLGGRRESVREAAIGNTNVLHNDRRAPKRLVVFLPVEGQAESGRVYTVLAEQRKCTRPGASRRSLRLRYRRRRPLRRCNCGAFPCDKDRWACNRRPSCTARTRRRRRPCLRRTVWCGERLAAHRHGKGDNPAKRAPHVTKATPCATRRPAHSLVPSSIPTTNINAGAHSVTF
jgi:hypothetical protein